MRAAAVIPARYASTRFPGKPMIVHVLERASRCRTISRIVVATDDQRIAAAVRAAGYEARMTRADHPNGTCRIQEVACQLSEELIVNIQGDEPQIEPELVDLTVRTLQAQPAEVPMATLVSPFAPGEDPANPNIVKCVLTTAHRALYFSRSLIPYHRAGGTEAAPFKHIGLYVYRRAFLDTFVTLPSTPLEQTECLEQLRVLEHGYSIACAVGQAHFTGIDTPEQYAAFVARWQDTR